MVPVAVTNVDKGDTSSITTPNTSDCTTTTLPIAIAEVSSATRSTTTVDVADALFRFTVVALTWLKETAVFVRIKEDDGPHNKRSQMV